MPGPVPAGRLLKRTPLLCRWVDGASSSLSFSSAVLPPPSPRTNHSPGSAIPQSRREGLYTKEKWLPSKTAIIVCDMWDLHHCQNAVTREGEMAPRMNQVLEKARGEGVLIIHAPSSCMKPYEGIRPRAREVRAHGRPLPDDRRVVPPDPGRGSAVYPIDQADGGEDDDLAEHAAWAKELEAKGLNPRAPVDEADRRAAHRPGEGRHQRLRRRDLEPARGPRHQQRDPLGVHLNMCVLGRPFGLRQMAKNGKNVVLMRDMTDTMYNPQRPPFVSHHAAPT